MVGVVGWGGSRDEEGEQWAAADCVLVLHHQGHFTETDFLRLLTSALSEYPVVHLIANLRRMSAVSWRSACTRAASAVTPATSGAWLFRKAARLAGSEVSSTAAGRQAREETGLVGWWRKAGGRWLAWMAVSAQDALAPPPQHPFPHRP